MGYLETMSRDRLNYGIPLSETYYQILLQETSNITSLHSDEEAKWEYAALTNVKFPTLQIVNKDAPAIPQETVPVNYAKPSNPSKRQEPAQVSILKPKHDKPSNSTLKCPLCKENHPTHQCLKT